MVFLMKHKFGKSEFKLSFIQSFLVAVYILIAFFITSAFDDALLVTSLGASAFIAFGFAKAESARARYIVGGYVCAVIWGVVFSFLRQWLMPELDISRMYFCVACVFAVVLSMTMLDFEHPPSVALAITVVFSDRPISISVVAVISIIALCIFKNAFLHFAEKVDMDEELEDMLKKK